MLEVAEKGVGGGNFLFYGVEGIEALVDLPIPTQNFSSDEKDQYNKCEDDKPANRGCEEGE